MEGGVGGVGKFHEADELLHLFLVPLRNCACNSMVLMDIKDVEGGVSGFLVLVTADMRRNTEGDRAESLLPDFVVG